MRGPRHLARDRRGSPAIEFAMALPAILALIMGLGELAYTAYVRAILVGAMQKAARDSGIQGNDTQSAAIDAVVLTAVRRVAPNAAFATGYPLRKSYAQFGYISPEPFTDSVKNGVKDGVCNNGESFTDINGNGVWDQDPGLSGQGSASNATVYTIVLSYPRLFPVAKIVGMSATGQLTSTVILKNQPYASQSNAVPSTKNCP